MYYRRKILLALLEVFDNRLEKINFQKLLMLVTKQQQNPFLIIGTFHPKHISQLSLF